MAQLQNLLVLGDSRFLNEINGKIDWSNILSKPTIPAAANNGTLTIQKNGTNVQTFTANQSTNVTANITVPTKVSELTNDSGYTTNTGTVTQVKVGTTAYNPSSGVISLPAYPSVPVSSVAGKTGAVTLTSSDVGLGNVGNFKAVSTVASQGLTATEKSNARTNIGAGTSNLALGTTSTTALKGDTKYAGASTAGGAATSAAKLTNTSKIGDTNRPVYFTASGVPAAISYAIGKSVPSDAVFTDQNVTQTAYVNNADYLILLSGTANGDSYTGGVRKSPYFTFNPNMYALTLGDRISNSSEGLCSVTFGYDNIASGSFTNVSGYGNIANHKSQYVFGEYNIADTSTSGGGNRGNLIEIIGNGEADDARSNARTLDWSGNEVLSGKLTVGAAPTNDMDVTTKQYVDTYTSTTYLPLTGGALSGDLSMIGWAEPKNNDITIGTTSNNGISSGTKSSGARWTDSNDFWYGAAYGTCNSSGQSIAQLSSRNKKTNGDVVTSTFQVITNKDGTTSYKLTSPSAFRSAIGAVNKAGDTMTGNLIVHGTAGISVSTQSDFCTIDTSSNNKVTTQRFIGFNMRDSAGYSFGQCISTAAANGHTETYIQVYNKKTDGTEVANQIRAQVTKVGAQTYYVTSAANFRTAIGAAASSSDRRLKTEISEVPDDLIKAVCECDIYKFKIMNDEPTGKFAIGIIAQDLVANCEKYNVDINDYEMVGLEKTKSTEDIDYYTINYFHYLTLKSLYYDRKIAQLEAIVNSLTNASI